MDVADERRLLGARHMDDRVEGDDHVERAGRKLHNGQRLPDQGGRGHVLAPDIQRRTCRG